MPHRRIQDDAGRWWDVWDSRPSIIDRRAGRDRRERRRGEVDRRQQSEERISVQPEFRNGWLVFQSENEWRRVAPIPERWDTLPDSELLALLTRGGDISSTARSPG